MRVAVFGGSFDPPHVAHVKAAKYVLSTGEVDRVLVLPVFEHAFGKPLAPFVHRVAMTRLAMAGESSVQVSALEESLGAPSRTLRTVERLGELHPDWVCRLVVGADVLAETAKWHRFDDVVRLAPLMVLGRVGVAREDAPTPLLPEVSSTEVRQRIADL
ncbi:MAG TPA: nicotinate-nicotinamide nucleotide adenylyltransferase, partial [Polyangiaceae bacterium]